MMLDNYKIPGKNLKVSLVLPLARKDISGQTSSTDTVSTGNKAKTLAIALTVPHKQPGDLRRLAAKAQALDTAGKPMVYVISDDLAEAMDIRQVEFTGDFRVDEQDNLQAWSVRFSLREHLSVPEKKEQRQEKPTPQETPATGDTVAATPEETPVNARELTGFESFLAKIDQALGGTVDTETT
ncbi:hypothetical protein GCM10023116_12910 [Kistimonas scapharcae]|uniref:DNA-binding protein n=1 Tax=Kistimonas scapharcae TaxID=1036133 RepID=A0ABP8UZE6_9GAMM